MFDIATILTNVGAETTKLVINKAPEILGGFGIGCFIFATVKAVQNTPKAMKKIEEEKAETTEEKVRAGWRYYVIPGIGIILGTVCVIASLCVYHKRTVNLATMCLGYEHLLAKQYEKTEEIVGKKKADEIKDAVSLDEVEKYKQDPISEEAIIHTGFGNVLFYETITGRLFRSSIEKVNDSERILCRKLMNEMTVSASDWFDLINIPRTDISDGCIWSVDNGLPELRRPCDKLPTQSSPNGNEPCFVLTFSPGPSTKYRNVYI